MDDPTLDPVIVTVTLNKCSDCRHADHSGAFTPGGAKRLCGHSNAPHYGGYPQYKNRILNPDGSIPMWCPLREGKKY